MYLSRKTILEVSPGVERAGIEFSGKALAKKQLVA